jgi:RHS repeat-associated protein
VGGSTPSYDANGNLTNDFLHTYTWDANGRPVSIDTVSLTYDAMGRMVEQGSGSTYTQIVYSPTGGKLALMNGQTLLKARVPLPGGGTATYTNSGLAYYSHADWLGNPRFFSTPTRTTYGDLAYAPFGETYASSGTPDVSFTGQNSDTVGGDYDFLFREYSIQGRWVSPDPAGLAAVDPTNPQSLNRYAYVMNAPTELIDPLGLCWFAETKDGCADDGEGGGGGFFLFIGCCNDRGGGGGGRSGGNSGNSGNNQNPPDNTGPNGPQGPWPKYPCIDPTGEPIPCPTNIDFSVSDTISVLLSGNGLYTVVQVKAQPPTPPPTGAAGGILARAGVCASSYYGFDGSPIGVATAVKAVALIPATPLPKSVLGLFGVRVTILGGGSGFSNMLSALGQRAGTAVRGTNLLRTAGRFWAPVAIASAAIDVTAIGVCTLID